MAFERLKTEIGILLTEMQNEPEDAHELAMQIHAKLQEMKAFGMPLPQDLIELEQTLLETGRKEEEGPQADS